MIEIDDLTKDYGHGRGIFHINLSVNKGECFGFLGPNGAGKTTTIRHLMGFSKPQTGSAKILGKECRDHAAQLQTTVGYLPGEIALPSGITGTEFLEMMRKMRHVENDEYCNMLLDKFELDPRMETKQMSLGVKRKLAVVTAFLHDPDILILDEPTSGLDPIMQEKFIEYVISEKKRGKTVFMSSHIFEEIEEVCDRVAMIRDGRIVDTIGLYQLRHWETKHFDLTFATDEDLRGFLMEWKRNGGRDSDNKDSGKQGISSTIEDTDAGKYSCSVELPKSETGLLLRALSHYTLTALHEEHLTLEQYFKKIYQKGER